MILQISAENVKKLREETGAGIMACKQALQASKGDINRATEQLRQKGLAIASKKSNRVAIEGIIESYIHLGSKIGVLVELNCETDFVARRPEFRTLAKNIAMQIAAASNVKYISIHDIPKEAIFKESEINKESLADRKEVIKFQVIQEKKNKNLQETVLLEQPFIKNPSITISSLIKQHIALLGENIRISRFTKFLLGETNSQVKS